MTTDTVKKRDFHKKLAAAYNGDAVAALEVAAAFMLGHMGIGINRVEAHKWYGRSADLGNASARSALQSLFQEYSLNAAIGDPEAQWLLGDLFESGVGVERNLESASRLYLKSAKQNCPRGLLQIGILFMRGELDDETLAEVKDIIAQKLRGAIARKVAKQIFPVFKVASFLLQTEEDRHLDVVNLCLLGMLYEGGRMPHKGVADAVPLYRKASGRGSATGHCLLALTQELAILPGSDKEKALSHLWGSANLGNSVAQWLLGIKYENGDGVPRDDVIAYDYYSRSAEQGDEDALAAMGRMISTGRILLDD